MVLVVFLAWTEEVWSEAMADLLATATARLAIFVVELGCSGEFK